MIPARAIATRHAEESPVASIVELTQALVRTPSRAGRDGYEAVVEVMTAWMRARRLPCTTLTDAGSRVVGLTGEIGGSRDGQLYLLDATLDTAPFGDRRKWRGPPTNGIIRDGWLYGRGTGDSKGGAALFAHLMATFAASRQKLSGRLAYLFDLDEHTGGFSGIRRYIEARTADALPSGAFIGYPGNDRIVIGGRGFARARIAVHGIAAHSGSNSHPGINAVERAARLVTGIAAWSPAGAELGNFPMPPRITVTKVRGGEGFSTVPDVCTVEIDARLTPMFTLDGARQVLAGLVAQTLPGDGVVPATTIDWLPESWPAYKIPERTPIVRALSTAARKAFGRAVPAAVAGPSNIGNYLAGLSIPAIAGFGVTARNIHGSDECIEIASIVPAWTAYRAALSELLR